jgi:hypothetical protein
VLQAGGTIRETETEVLVASIGGGMQPRRMALCGQLWAAGIKAEFGYKPNPKMADQVGGWGRCRCRSCVGVGVIAVQDTISATLTCAAPLRAHYRGSCCLQRPMSACFPAPCFLPCSWGMH